MSGRKYLEVLLAQIVCERQVRESFEGAAAAELDRSIERHGILQPLLVVAEGTDRFRLVDGESRLRAAKRLGLATVPIVLDTDALDGARTIERQLLLNSIRTDHSPLERSRGVNRWIEEHDGTPAQAAEALGVTESAVAKLRVLSRLPDPVQRLLASGKLAAATAYELSRLSDSDAQESVAIEAARRGLSRDAVARRVRAFGAKQKDQPRARPAKARRVELHLSGARRLVFSGDGIDSIEDVIAWMDELAGKARKAKSSMSLATFVRLLDDQAKASSSNAEGEA